MKTKRLIPIVLIFLFAVSFEGCKKRYPEGPIISLRSPMKRICQKWKIWGFYVNGVNYTDSLSNIASITFKKEDPNSVNGPHTRNEYYIDFKPPGDTLTWIDGFYFYNKNRDFVLYGITTKYPNSIKTLFYGSKLQIGYNADYKIMKLRNKSVVLKREQNGNTYLLQLKPY